VGTHEEEEHQMNSTIPRPGYPQRATCVIATCGLLLILAAVQAGSARASFEQVKTFGEGTAQLRVPTGTAVNTTGAGGVPVGTLYAVAENSASVARYSPQGEFRAAWGWGVGDPEMEGIEVENKENGKKEIRFVSRAGYQRCGPDGDLAYPTCEDRKEASEKPLADGLGIGGEGLGQLRTPKGIAVDQATGNVYVFNSGRKKGTVQVFSADGSQRLGGFGELGERGNFPEPAESIEEGPDKFHVTNNNAVLTVGESGKVYIPDLDFAEAPGSQLSRVMVFEPQTPGGYEHYVYAGRSNDLPNTGIGPVASDYAGNVYVGLDTSIYELDPSSGLPVCKFELLTGGIWAMTADPETGEVYYFNYKKKNFHRLVCNSEGKFVDTEVFEPVPKIKGEVFYVGLSFNPATSFDETRPPGIFYAMEPEPGGAIGGVVHVFAPGAVISPTVESQTATEVGIDSAALQAVVNPKGAATRYVFQYISDAAYQANDPAERFAGAAERPNGGGDLQSGVAGIPVGVALTGLQPDTQYHFRIVAENCTEGQETSLCTTESEGETFRTFPAGAGGTPDHRAYELVSPAQKHGGQVYPADTRLFTPSCLECKPGHQAIRYPSFSSPDGERVAYEGDPFSSTEGTPNDDAYLAVRTASGWQTTTLNPSLGSGGTDSGLVGYDDALSKGVLAQGTPSLTATAPSEVPNLYTLPTASPDNLSPLLMTEPPNTGSEVKLIYGGSSSDLGHIFFIATDALTQETAYAPAAQFETNRNNLYEYFNGQVRLVNVLPGNTETVVGAAFGARSELSSSLEGNFSHAISEDGSRVFWSDPSGQVYVREGGVSTRELPDHSGEFLTANSDGSKVLLTNGNLIDLDNGESTVDLTQGNGGFLGIAGQSEDLSRIYFVDTAVLDEAPNSEGASAIAGQSNLYAWNESTTTFVATLNGKGQVDERDTWAKSPAARSAAASPNGKWLAFESSAPLVGQDNQGPCAGNGTEFDEGPCTDVYLYDSASGEIVCPSCSPTEEATLGLSHLTNLTGPTAALPQQRYITDAGRLFFDSPDRLSPSDTNNGAEDVYEYEPAGVGTCTEAGECVSLVSAGDEFTDSNLLFIDPSGKNAFFTTREQLSLRDRDELIDLYDARENGGLAAESETIRNECQGEACQAPVQVPNDPTPGSSTFNGPGNVGEKTPRKHKKKHHKKHKKHHKKKHHKKHKSNGKRAATAGANHNRGGAK
jgi:DNA-binding beta-propeller fold protein YncE